MTIRSGSADLPLHGGRVPAWLATRMAALGRLIVETIAIEYSTDEVLRRLSHPFWFQSFGAVMGMDWHSSGITTSVIGALKRGLEPVASELGLYVCGGRGRHSRKTPDELLRVGEREGLDGGELAAHSKLTAKVDSAAVQDGFELYLHAFIVSKSGQWTVVQQGMNGEQKQARRYHWLSEGLESFVDSPHQAIDGENQGTIINLADSRAAACRAAQLSLLSERDPASILREWGAIRRAAKRSARQAPPQAQQIPLHLVMPAHHDVRETDVILRRIHGALQAAKERGPKDFPELLATPGVGPRTVAALAQVAEVIHGTPSRFSDPARFSLAHGGKDGHPFPVPLAVYDRTIAQLKRAVERARKLGQKDKLAALAQLDRASRLAEQRAAAAGQVGPSFDALVARERARSSRFAGRAVGRPALPPRTSSTSEPRSSSQLPLPGFTLK
jgi:hypothetical protein